MAHARSTSRADIGPPGVDDYVALDIEEGGGSGQFQQQRGDGRSQPPTWNPTTLPAAWYPGGQLHVTLPKVELKHIWSNDPRSWFVLAESKFNRAGITDSCHVTANGELAGFAAS